jgi:hypothetical protein
VISAALATLGLSGLAPTLSADDVTLAELEGVPLQAEIGMEQTVRRQGGTAQATITQQWSLTINSDRTVGFDVASTARSALGTRKAEPVRGTVALEEARQIPTLGGGLAMWSFAAGTLTFTRTLPGGAYRVRFVFERAPQGLICTVNAGYARENGKGAIRLQSPFGGGEVTIVDARQVASSCNVGTPAAPKPRSGTGGSAREGRSPISPSPAAAGRGVIHRLVRNP